MKLYICNNKLRCKEEKLKLKLKKKCQIIYYKIKNKNY